VANRARLILPPWRWRRYVPPKRRLTFNGLHGVISQKVVSTLHLHVCTDRDAVFPVRQEADLYTLFSSALYFKGTNVPTSISTQVSPNTSLKHHHLHQLVQWRPVICYQRFGGTFCLHHYGMKTSDITTFISYPVAVGIAQSVQRWPTGWTAKVRIPAGARFFSSPQCPDWLWGQPSLLSTG
jgi:hypothetical protein